MTQAAQWPVEQSWQSIQPGGDTVCSDGSPYSFHVKARRAGQAVHFSKRGRCLF